MLTGKLAIVTGGARGIGTGIARVLAGQGARVALLDVDGPEAEKTAAGLPVPGMALACDVAVEADTEAAVRAVVERFGGLDIVVNNAGVGRGPVDPNVPRAAPGTLGLDAMSAARRDERGVPLGREQTPEDIGQLAAFLASDAARNITGQWIAVDGGITLRQSL